MVLINPQKIVIKKMMDTGTSIVITNFSINEPGMSCPCCDGNKIQYKVLEALQIVRNSLQLPISIASGYRCETYNRGIGSKITSSHIKGLAVDISIYHSTYAYLLMKAIYKTEVFKRIGFGEIKGKTVLHLDLDLDKIQNVLFGY